MRKQKMMRNSTLILIALLFVSACGYHLRGSLDLPEGLKTVYIQGASRQLMRLFKRTMRSSDGTIVSSAQQAGLAIHVLKEKMDRRVLSLSSTGRSNEFELTYFIDFILFDMEGKRLGNAQKIEISRDYFNDQEDVLGKNNEEKVIREEMYRQAIQAIFNRARAALETTKN